MVKIGDKVVVVKAADYDACAVGDVLIVDCATNHYGFWARSTDGELHYVRVAGNNGHSHIIVRPYTESEAEKRGAKFGTMGVVKVTGQKWVFVKEIAGMWHGFTEKGSDFGNPSSFRLDHEPEFIAWEDAPEELKYDSIRVYYDGQPVKWIAKPEWADLADVVYVAHTGVIRCASEALMVKL